MTARGREAVLLALTPLAPLVGLAPGGAWLVPLLAPLTVYPGMVRRVRAGAYGSAWGLVMSWALLLSAAVVTFVWAAPEAAAGAILRGESYRQEMFSWIATGAGREGDWRLFLPQHLLHLGAFVALTWVSAGYLGLALGAFLLNYMSYFVGSFAASASSWLLGPIVAWVPWSVLRVMAFVMLGVLFARPVLERRPWPFGAPERRLMLLAAGGILADILLKASLAPAYGIFLRRLHEAAQLGS